MSGPLEIQAKRIHAPKFRRIHVGWIIMIVAALLTIVGVEAIETTRPSIAIRQLGLGCIGFVFAIVIAYIPTQRIRQTSWWVFIIGLAMLVFLLIPSVPDFLVHPRNGARRWINLFVTDVQPSELVKIAFVLALASYLRFRRHYRKFKGLLAAFCIAIPPMFSHSDRARFGHCYVIFALYDCNAHRSRRKVPPPCGHCIACNSCCRINVPIAEDSPEGTHSSV